MADDPGQIDQNEIERLLNTAKDGGTDPPAQDQDPPAGDQPPAEEREAAIDQGEIEALLNQGGAAQPPAAAADTAAEGDDGTLQQDDIEALLSQGGGKKPAESTPAAPKPAAAAAETTAGGSGNAPGGDLEFLLDQAQNALASLDSGSAGDLPAGVEVFQLEQFGRTPPSSEAATLELVRDVELELRIELGRTHMHLEDVLKLRRGSVVPLDKLAGDPVDVYVNGRLVARGEVLVLNDNFCVRVGELLAGDRAKAG